jgi:hypothetical protein
MTGNARARRPSQCFLAACGPLLAAACVPLLAAACGGDGPAPPRGAADDPVARQSADEDGRLRLRDHSDGASALVEEVGRLSFAGLPRAPSAFARVFPLPTGGWGVTSGVFNHVVQLFDSLGNPAGTLGRSGAGPGEFDGAIRGVVSGDHLYITDTGNRRLSRFDRNLAFVDARPLSAGVVSLSTTNEPATVLVSGSIAGSTAGLEANGELRSVGLYRMEPVHDRIGGHFPDYTDDAKAQQQHAAMAPTGAVWTVARTGGAVDLLSDSLAVIERFRIPIANYADLNPGSSAEAPPPPEVTGITAGPDGTLWVVIGVPDPQWTPLLDDDVHGIHPMFDTLLLAIDPSSRTIVASTTIDPVCFPVQNAHLSCVYDADEHVRLLRVQLSAH